MNMLSRYPFDDRPDGLRRRLADLPPSLRWGALAAFLIAVIFIGWLGIQGLSAKSNLEQARDSAEQAKDALLSGESENATRFAENAEFHAREARAATHSLPWSIAAAVPFLGSPLKTTQQISDVVVGLTGDVLLPAADMGAGLSPDKLIEGTRIDLKLLRAEAPRLSKLSDAAAKIDAEARAISDPAYLWLIRDARSQLQGQTSRLAQLLGNTSIAAQLAPSMLGADGPRTYLVGLQNNAEARGTGGLMGGFGILVFNDGRASVPGLAPNNWFGGVTAKVDLGPEFNATYGWTNPYTDIRNSNLSSHFPYAAQIWKSMWDEISPVDQPIDGVIALDPVALSYVLGAIGPVSTSDGVIVTQDNVVELMESTAYVRFPTEEDQYARKKYLQDVAEAVIKKATTGAMQSPRKLLDALGRAIAERRIAVWSASPADQKLLEQTPLAHIVPDGPAPYAGVVLNNLAGNKMDYYLRREIEYVADDCDGDMRNSTITVRLNNTAPDVGLPEYVGGSEGLAAGLALNVPSGTMVTSVRVIATKGARLLSVTSNGKRTSATQTVERGHPSFEVQVAIPRGESGELTFQFSEPTAPGIASVPVQPLIDTPKPDVSVPTCPEAA
jgi:hypothetical protein